MQDTNDSAALPNNVPRTSRAFAVDVFSGTGIGLLLGMVVGMSASPVVGVVVGALTSILAVFLGLEGGDGKVAALANLQLNGVRIGSFGVAAVLGVLLGLYVRINNPLANSPKAQMERWQAAFPDNPALAGQMMIFERSRLQPATLAIDKGKVVDVKIAEGPDTNKSVLFSSLQGKDLCRDLDAKHFADIDKNLDAYEDQGELLASVVKTIKAQPQEQRSSSLAAIHDFLCKLEQAKMLK